MKKSDSELIKIIQEGDLSAFEELLKRYELKLWKFVGNWIEDEMERDDLVQEVFIKVFKNSNKIRAEDNVRAYLYTVTRNTVFDWLRKKKRTLPLLDSLIDEKQLVVEEVMKNEEREKLNNAVRILPEKQKKAIRLYYFDDLPYKRIAEIMKMPINSIKTVLRRAKISLRRKIK